MGEKAKILVIDDSPIICRIVELALSRYGYEVISAYHGADGIRLALEERPDCIILDVMMPELDGFRVCQILRAKDSLRDVPIIMFTAKNTRADVVTSVKAGADDFIIKPARPDLLHAKVEKALREGTRREKGKGASPPEPAENWRERAREIIRQQGVSAEEKAARLVREIPELMALPQIVQKALTLSGDEDSSAEDLARCAAADPAIASSLLRLANSVHYGKSEKITSVKEAVVRMGFRQTRCRILDMAVYKLGLTPSEGTPFDRLAFWRHSLACAIAARLLTRSAGGGDEEAAYLAGLLHDIGKIVFDEYFREELERALSHAASQGMPLHAAERLILGTNHVSVGAYLAESWHLAGEVRAAILGHHDAASAPGASPRPPVVASVFAANLLAKVFHLGTGGDLRIREIPEGERALFADALEDPAGLREVVRAQLAETEEFLSVERGLIAESAGEVGDGIEVDLWLPGPPRFSICGAFLQASGFRPRRIADLSAARAEVPLICRVDGSVPAEALAPLAKREADSRAPAIAILAGEGEDSRVLPHGLTLLREPYDCGELAAQAVAGVRGTEAETGTPRAETPA